MSNGCFKIHKDDNVATLLVTAECQSIPVSGDGEATSITLTEPIDLGHKVALLDIEKGEAIVKFGIPIGYASETIRRGAWVHLHNCQSGYDTRSGSLDLHTGATTDTKYE